MRPPPSGIGPVTTLSPGHSGTFMCVYGSYSPAAEEYVVKLPGYESIECARIGDRLHMLIASLHRTTFYGLVTTAGPSSGYLEHMQEVTDRLPIKEVSVAELVCRLCICRAFRD